MSLPRAPAAPARPPEALSLLAASQPDMVRASQKDETYAEQYVEATREVTRRLLGPFRALQHARETKLLALLAYHGLTTGLGSATLGEEYCGMEQVTEDGLAPALGRRLLLALLLSCGPYAADRLASRLDHAAEAEADAAEIAAAAAEAAAASSLGASAPAGDERESPDGHPSAGPWGMGVGAEVERSEVQAEEGAGGRQAHVGSEGEQAGPSGRGLRGWWRLIVAAAAARLARLWRALVLSWPQARPLLLYAGRVHLALFYLFGAYYSLPHRLAGVRYALTIRPLAGRPSYRALGLLLGLQLTVVAASAARGPLRRALAAARRSLGLAAAAGAGEEGAEAGEEGNAGAGRRHGRGRGKGRPEDRYAPEGEVAVMLSDNEDEAEEPTEEEEEEEEEGVGSSGHARAEDGQAGVRAPGTAGPSGREPVGGSPWAVGGAAGGGGGGGGGGWEESVFGRVQTEESQAAPSRAAPAAAAGGGGAGAEAEAADHGRRRRARQERQPAAAHPMVVPVLTSVRQCPLCLSPKSHPAATPCGHTFCWSCIATWCAEKPECPLCRSAVRLPQLVALYHTNC